MGEEENIVPLPDLLWVLLSLRQDSQGGLTEHNTSTIIMLGEPPLLEVTLDN